MAKNLFISRFLKSLFRNLFFQQNDYFVIFEKFKNAEPVVRRSSVKKLFLEVSQNSQEKTPVSESFFNKVASLRTATLFKKRLWHRCFPVNFAIFLRTPFLTEQLRWLLLKLSLSKSLVVQRCIQNQAKYLNFKL